MWRASCVRSQHLQSSSSNTRGMVAHRVSQAAFELWRVHTQRKRGAQTLLRLCERMLARRVLRVWLARFQEDIKHDAAQRELDLATRFRLWKRWTHQRRAEKVCLLSCLP